MDTPCSKSCKRILTNGSNNVPKVANSLALKLINHFLTVLLKTKYIWIIPCIVRKYVPPTIIHPPLKCSTGNSTPLSKEKGSATAPLPPLKTIEIMTNNTAKNISQLAIINYTNGTIIPTSQPTHLLIWEESIFPLASTISFPFQAHVSFCSSSHHGSSQHESKEPRCAHMDNTNNGPIANKDKDNGSKEGLPLLSQTIS